MRYRPGIDPVPYYEDGAYGIRCKKCGEEFVGIHLCRTENEFH